MGVLSFENQIANHKQASNGPSQIFSAKKKGGNRNKDSPLCLLLKPDKERYNSQI